MSNPTASGVLLAALIGSNVVMVSKNSELERNNAYIERKLDAMSLQLEKMIKIRNDEREEKEAKEAYDKKSMSDKSKLSDEFFKDRSKEFENLEWYGPRKY